MEQSASREYLFNYALWLTHLGKAHLLAGRIEEAIRFGECALEYAQVHKERGHEAWALRLLGEIAAQRDYPEIKQAEDYFRRALVLADELGMRPLQAHSHRDLGLLYAKIGRQAEARVELSAAIALYRDISTWARMRKDVHRPLLLRDGTGYPPSGKYPLHELCIHSYCLADVGLAIRTVGGDGVPGGIHVSVLPWS